MLVLCLLTILCSIEGYFTLTTFGRGSDTRFTRPPSYYQSYYDTSYTTSGPVELTAVAGKKIYVGAYPLSYNESVEFCAEHGWELVSIANDEENQAIYEHIRFKSYKERFWINGHKQGDKVTWKYLNGTRMHYFKWDVGEPNEYFTGREHCIEMMNYCYEPSHCVRSAWNDELCETPHHYICEKVDFKQSVPQNLQQKPNLASNCLPIFILNFTMFLFLKIDMFL